MDYKGKACMEIKNKFILGFLSIFIFHSIEASDLTVQCLAYSIRNHTKGTFHLMSRSETLTKPKINLDISRNVIYMRAEGLDYVEKFDYVNNPYKDWRRYFSKNNMYIKLNLKNVNFVWSINTGTDNIDFHYVCAKNYKIILDNEPNFNK